MIKFSFSPLRIKPHLSVFCAVVGLLLVPGIGSRAQVVLNLTPAAGTGAAGSTIIYDGTITNLSSSAVTLNSATFGSLSPATSLITENDDGLFYGSLAAGSTYTGDIFSVTLAPTITTSSYIGSVGILYSNGASVSNFQNFIINATGGAGAMPEPGTLALFSSALPAVGIAALRRRGKSSSVKR